MTTPNFDAEQRRRRGLALYLDIMATEPPEPTTPRAGALIDFVFAEIWSRPGLSRRDRRIIALSCAAGTGSRTVLADHLFAAMTTGDLDLAELDEFVLHFAVYGGWAKAEALEEILTEQVRRVAAEGGRVEARRSTRPTRPEPVDQDVRRQRGGHEFRSVNCHELPTLVAPYYDGMVDFVFGEVWTRSGLNRRDRRLVSLTCVGLAGAVGPIQSHVYSAMKSGDISCDEMLEIVLQFAAYAGWPKAQYIQQSVDEMRMRIADEETARAEGGASPRAIADAASADSAMSSGSGR